MYYVMIVTDIITDVCSVRATVNWSCQRIAWISNVLALSCCRVIGSEVSVALIRSQNLSCSQIMNICGNKTE